MRVMAMFQQPGTDRISMGRSSGWILMFFGSLLLVGTVAATWLEVVGRIRPGAADALPPWWAGFAMVAAGGALYAVTKFKAGPIEVETERAEPDREGSADR